MQYTPLASTPLSHGISLFRVSPLICLLIVKYTVSFSKVVLSQGAVNKVFLGVFLMFLAFFHSKIWAKFHFGTFKPYD